MVAELRERGIGFTSLHETWTPPIPVIGSSSMSSPRSRSSSANSSSSAPRRAWWPLAPAAGSADAPSVAAKEIIRAARDLLPDPGRSITSIAKLLGVSPGTLYNHIPDLRELRAGVVPRQLEAPVR